MYFISIGGMSIEQLLVRIEGYLPYSSEENTNVSLRGVDWHLDHILKVINAISTALINSDPKAYTPKWSIGKTFILTTAYIPRGRGRSPKDLNNRDTININDLTKQLKEARTNLNSLKHLSQQHFVKHPYFGDLRLKQAMKFIMIHSHHHIKIIKDIIRGGIN